MYVQTEEHARPCSVICMCLPTNIEIFSFIFNITGEQTQHARIQIREVRHFTLATSPHPSGGYSVRRGMESKAEARDEFAAHGSANTGFHQDRIQIGNMFTLKTFPSVRAVYILDAFIAHIGVGAANIVATLFNSDV